MIRTVARRTGLIAIAAYLAACPPGGEQARAVEWEQARQAIVSLQGDAGGRSLPGLPPGDAADILRDFGFRQSDAPGPPRLPAARSVTTAVWIDDGALLLSLLPSTMRNSDQLHAVGADAQPQRMTVLAWDPSSGLTVLGPDVATSAADPDGNRRRDPGGAQPARSGNGDVPTGSATTQASALTIGSSAAPWGAPVRVLAAWQPGSPAVFAGIVATETAFDSRLGAEVFQVDSALPSVARGGPVVDQDGQVVGVIAATIAGGGASGPASAIGLEPIGRLLTFVRDGGRGVLPKPRLGVALKASPEGVRVGSSLEGSPAQQAGLAAGDRIVEIDHQPVRNPEQVIGAVNAHQPGDAMQVTIERDGQRQQLMVTLGAAPPPSSERTTDAADLERPALSAGDVLMTPDELRRQWEQLDQPLGARPPGSAPFPPQPPRILAPAVPDELSDQLQELNEQLRQLRQQLQQDPPEPAPGEERQE